MALAVTHIILTIVILDLLRHYLFGKHRFPRYLLVIGGIAGLFPDIDIILTWLYNLFTSQSINLHRLFTHSFLFPLIFLALALFLHYRKNLEWAKVLYVVSAGWAFHLFLDCLFGGYKELIWPFFIQNFCPSWPIARYSVEIDAVLLVLWLLHEEVHQRIKDYI